MLRPQAAAVFAYALFDVGERLYLGFERLIVLALDLKLGLQFLDQQFKTRNFHAKLLQVGRRRTWAHGRRGRMRFRLPLRRRTR